MLTSPQFRLGDNHDVMGAPLHVLLPINRKAGDKVRVQVFYSTTSDCTAVQWLDKEYVPYLANMISARDLI